MNRTPLLLVPLALLLGAGVWFLFGNGDEPAPPADRGQQSGQHSGAAEAAGPVESGSNGAVDAGAATDDDGAARDAVSVRQALVAMPDEPDWLAVRIVDKQSGEAVPGATVLWHDETIEKELQEHPEHLGLDEVSVWKDPEDLASRFGWQTTSDAHGIARIHRAETTKVTARLGRLYGHAVISAEMLPPRDGFRVELEADLGFEVRVLTAAGLPAIGVPIAVLIGDEKGRFERLLHWGPLAETRSPDGIARLTHAHLWHKLLPKTRPTELRVQPWIPGLHDAGLLLDMDAPLTEPLVLTLPACGKIRARAEVRGQPTTPEEYRLREHLPMARNRPSPERRPDETGWCTFDYVPLGKEYSASARIKGGWVSQQFSGPVADGATVDVVLSPTDKEMMLTGRLLDRDRQPLANQDFRLRLSGRISRNNGLQTDEDGRFLALLGGERNNNRADTIAAHVQREGERPLVARALGRDLRAGTEDLGDLVLELDQPVLAGRCEVDGAPGKLPRAARIERYEEREGRPARWRNVSNLPVYTQDDGTFEFYGTPPATRLRLKINTREHLDFEPIEFQLGARDVIVRLQLGAQIAATVLLPGESWQNFMATLTKLDGEQGTEARALLWGREDGRHQAQWKGLEPGTYDFSMSLEGLPEPLVEIPGIAVPPPPGGDPRLVDVDLRDRMHVQIVRFFDQTGKPFRGGSGALFPMGQDPEKELRGYFCAGPETKVMLPKQPTPMLLGMPGYRPLEIQCTGEPLEVRLDPWPKVTLTFAGLTQLPEGVTVRASLQLADPSKRRWQARFWSGRTAELYAPKEKFETVKDGRVELAIGDKPQLVKVSVRYKRQSETVEIPAQRARMTTPTMAVQVPAAALQSAIDAVTKKK